MREALKQNRNKAEAQPAPFERGDFASFCVTEMQKKVSGFCDSSTSNNR